MNDMAGHGWSWLARQLREWRCKLHELHLSMAMKPCVGPPLFKSGSNRVNLHTSTIQHHWVSGTKSWLSHGYGPKPHRFTAGWKALWKFRVSIHWVKDAQQLDACYISPWLNILEHWSGKTQKILKASQTSENNQFTMKPEASFPIVHWSQVGCRDESWCEHGVWSIPYSSQGWYCVCGNLDGRDSSMIVAIAVMLSSWYMRCIDLTLIW